VAGNWPAAAAGISEAKVAQLKSGACALVLGPYAADIVERQRKEHNARRIRGFDSATVVDDRDFVTAREECLCEM